ncbi:MAG: hypothetical protein R6W76_16150 [Caldilinea sp.]
MLYHDMQTKVLKNMVSKGAADGAADGIVLAFNYGTGEAFIEEVQEFIPPVQERACELFQWSDTGCLGLIQPCAQEVFGLRAVLDFVGNRDESFFEQVGCAQFWKRLQSSPQLDFFCGFQVSPPSHQNPENAFEQFVGGFVGFGLQVAADFGNRIIQLK